MIALTRLGGDPLTVNADLILSIERTPDTLLSFVNGDKLMVRETPEEVVAMAVAYRRQCTPPPLETWTPATEQNDARP